MRIVGLLLALIACAITVYAQDTYYYKQVKVEKKGSTIAQGNGGRLYRSTRIYATTPITKVFQ